MAHATSGCASCSRIARPHPRSSTISLWIFRVTLSMPTAALVSPAFSITITWRSLDPQLAVMPRWLSLVAYVAALLTVVGRKEKVTGASEGCDDCCGARQLSGESDCQT